MNQVVSKSSNGRTMTLSECAICGGEKSKFSKSKKQKDY